ncbi:flagellar filament capping protein FliD [Lederbergia citrea]|uniref:flagellar filament capping protein FliD n=1 Tax=Lederbergia citrea TaxID=2833581 RepID=UPI001BC93624|nr:flagellar filament capping protein FliD [Lederbergia citrea]MBS4204977.1 flagellar filament capping protein FliD [Lederbergia citrea]
MRIAGLASGMDIDSIVKNLMMAERMPLEKLKQKKQILEWQRDDFRALNTQLLTFRDKLAQLKLTPNYRARTVVSSNDARVSATVTSGASQASYSISEVTQLASAAVRKNAGKISKIGSDKIDPNTSLFNQKGAFDGTIKPNQTWDEAWGETWQQGVVETKTFNYKKGDPAIKLDLSTGALKDGVNPTIKVNGQTIKVVTGTPNSGEVSIEVDGTLKFGTELTKDSVVKVDYILANKTQSITTEKDVPLKSWNLGKGSIADLKVTIGGTVYEMDSESDNLIGVNGEPSIGKVDTTTGIITFNGDGIPGETTVDVNFQQNYSSFGITTHTSKGVIEEQFFITGNDSLNSVIRKVNESNAGVTMFYDSFSDQMTLTRKETGDFNKDSGTADAPLRNGEIQVSGNFMTSILKFDNDIKYETGGQNAKFTINGLVTERNSNTFDMNGVTFTLKQVFKDIPGESEPVSISIGNDTNQVFQNIKNFVDQYNELIAEIGKKLNEERHRSYKPLTDDEREELSEKQQEKWEEMARSGLLKGDPILSSVLSAMRFDMSSTVETNGLFKQLASIGIKTTANYMEGGKLEIDETKLKAALEQDPEAVENLFRGSGTGSDRGIIHKLYDTVDASMKKLQEKAGRATSTNQQFALGRELLSVGKGIDRFEDKMKIVENRYWRQFTAMEKAIQRANEQSMFLMQQFSNF